MTHVTTRQHPILFRVVCIVLVGWWWGLIWLAIAWARGLLIVTLPLSILMIDRSPAEDLLGYGVVSLGLQCIF